MMDNIRDAGHKEKKGFSGLQVLAIVAGAVAVTVLLLLTITWVVVFPGTFTPVDLTSGEQQQLAAKLDRLESFTGAGPPEIDSRRQQVHTDGEYIRDGRLPPQPYSEQGADREIFFSERELNGLLAANTDLADKLAIDLADDLVSARMLVPLDPDFPVLGGKTLRLRAGLELAYRQGRPVVILKGISLMGVPLPNAWLGGLKNIDLVEKFNAEPGFWRSLAEGVEMLRVEEGNIYLVLKE